MINRREGFSLVEVLIGLVLLAVALLSIASSFTSSTKVMIHSIDTEKATLIASEILDKIEAQEYSDLSYGSLSSDIDIPSAYSVTWTDTDNGDSKTIQLTISWNGVGKVNAVNMERDISRFGHQVVE